MEHLDKLDALLTNANTFKNNNIRSKHINECIHENIRKIDTELKTAHRDGQHYIITELPIIFDIPNMQNKDAQRIIWAKTIELLQKKNYIVNINHNQDNCRLKISWLDQIQRENIKHELRILEECRSDRF